ncbi:hypothetical protein JW824_01420 [bacterium]|nr:hypothetical protein [bacterium]
MRTLGYYFYNFIVVPFLYVGFSFGGIFHSKIKRGIRGRKYLFENLEKRMQSLSRKHPRFWIHNSSMGEFEQAKPLIRHLKKRFPNSCIVVSFFSPSGFDHVQHDREADYVCYIPFDSRKRAGRFLSLVQPDVAIMVRHDLWPNHLWELKKRRIPTVLINCSIRSQSCCRIPFILQANRMMLRIFDVILTVSQDTKHFCDTLRLGETKIETVGDTRYDQVVQRAKEAEKIIAPLRKIKGNRKCFVAGSTWPTDEAVLFEGISKLLREEKNIWIVIVPHEPTNEHLCRIEEQIAQLGLRSNRLSEAGKRDCTGSELLIVDRVGILASLYALGDLTFVGGGFGPGVHNVLEPAALGKIVLFGPRCQNSYEAGLLEKRGVGLIVKNGDAIYNRLNGFLKNSHELADLGPKAANLVRENVGATERIVHYLGKWVPPR